MAEALEVSPAPKLVVGLIGLGRRWVSRSRSQFKVWWASVGEETHKTPNAYSAPTGSAPVPARRGEGATRAEPVRCRALFGVIGKQTPGVWRPIKPFGLE